MAARVMVVEDDEELGEILTYNLRRAGYHVQQIADGKEAMAAIRREQPDLVLLDIMLPGADGWEVCRYLADEPDLRRIPVIVFTARSAIEDYETVRSFNLAGYFTKPYATQDVLRHVEKVLTAHSARGGAAPGG